MGQLDVQLRTSDFWAGGGQAVACTAKSLFLCAPRRFLFNLLRANFVGLIGTCGRLQIGLLNIPIKFSNRPIDIGRQVTNLPHTICHNRAMRFVLVLLFCLGAWAADTMPPEAEQRLAREIYKQMIEVKSGFSTGSTTPIAESVAARFRAAGFPASDIFVGGAIPTKANVVVRYRGTGARKPLLLLAHIDVVEARREDWTVDPFTLLEKDGFFYGRGTA